ncbi:phosphoribosylaminoimidazole carboxylase [subsurface metagenome]
MFKESSENMKNKVVILMGSKSDIEFSHEIAKHLKVFKLDFEYRVASAHKTPEKVLEIIKGYENEKIVYITVAGRSNALSAFVDANTLKPVIACPPYSEKFSGADIYSSLRVPSGVGSLVTIEPEGAAVAAAKIFALKDHELARLVREYQLKNKRKIEASDRAVREMD